MASVNDDAVALKGLHNPSQPLILTNVWDVMSLNAVLSLNTPTSQPVKAIATASYAVAESQNVRDNDLTLEQNLSAIAKLAPIVREARIPLTVDLQDGYGERIAEVVKAAVELGASGANIEDSIPSAGYDKGIEGSLYPWRTQVARIKAALRAATEAGCPDFVINARCDVFCLTPYVADDDEAALTEAITRGKAYLAAGATTIFFWGLYRGLRTSEVERLVEELEGRVSVKIGTKEGALTTAELGKIGVARVSIGPSLYMVATAAMKKAAASLLSGKGLDG